jgi:hypothetical protein
MTAYVTVTDEVTFLQQLEEARYVVIHEGPPSTVSEGQISMFDNIVGSTQYIDKLVVESVYKLEPPPSDLEAGARCDKINRNGEIARGQTDAARRARVDGPGVPYSIFHFRHLPEDLLHPRIDDPMTKVMCKSTALVHT